MYSVEGCYPHLVQRDEHEGNSSVRRGVRNIFTRYLHHLARFMVKL